MPMSKTGSLPIYTNILGIDLDLKLFTLASNVTNFTLRNFKVPQTKKMFEIYDDAFIMDLEDFSLDFDIDYEFISDPPVFADLGTMENHVSHLDFKINMTTSYEDYDVTLIINQLLLDVKTLDIVFDGVSDFSTVITSLTNKVVGLVWVKIENLIYTKLQDKVVPLINKFLDQLPE